MQNPIITITTLSGLQVSAPVYVWLQELILCLPPHDIEVLMKRVEHAKSPPLVQPVRAVVEADPAAYLNPDGTPRKQFPRRT